METSPRSSTASASAGLFWLCVVACLLGAGAFRMMAGGTVIGVPETAEIWEIRGLRLAVACVLGGALGVAGVMLQALMRNPLASPDLVGVSSGAGLATTLGAWIAWRSGETIAAGGLRGAPAVVGALLALAIVYGLAQRRGRVEPVTILLIGVIVSVICAAIAMLVATMMPPEPAGVAARVLFGSIGDDVGWPTVAVVGALACVGGIVAFASARSLDAMAMEDDEATSVGVRLGSMRLVLFALSGVLTAGTVALAGTIGFVGLLAPHVSRLALGPGHRALVPAAAVVGAAVVVCADACSAGLRVAGLGVGRVPVGVLTALVGGPVFLLLLARPSVRLGLLGSDR